jgi:glycosyltransferase involved in cell wall biosynthesis
MSSVAPSSYSKISLVMPVLNQGTYLESAINSVLSGNYPNRKNLICDGGSSDKSTSAMQRTYGLREPSYIMSRVINRFDRLQWLSYRTLFRAHSDPDRASD